MTLTPIWKGPTGMNGKDDDPSIYDLPSPEDRPPDQPKVGGGGAIRATPPQPLHAGAPSVTVTEFPDVIDPPQFANIDLGGREWFAIIFASTVLLVIVITLCIILMNGYAPIPDLSKTPLSDRKEAIEQFNALNEVLKQRTETMFDLIIVKAFLPLLATLVGFVLGTKVKSE